MRITANDKDGQDQLGNSIDPEEPYPVLVTSRDRLLAQRDRPDPPAQQLLAARARDGCQVRTATLDPDTAIAELADREHRPPGRLTRRIQASHQQLLALHDPPRIEVCQHHVATSHTILRFDDTILLTIHLHGTPGFQAPLLHLQREHDYGILDQLAKHIDDTWQTAAPTAASGDAKPASAANQADAERQQFLDSLDNP